MLESLVYVSFGLQNILRTYIQLTAASQGDVGGLEPQREILNSLAHLVALCGNSYFVYQPVHKRSLVEVELRSSDDPVTSQTRVRLGGFLTWYHDLPEGAVGFRSLEACRGSWNNGQLTFGIKKARLLHPLGSVSQSDPGKLLYEPGHLLAGLS